MDFCLIASGWLDPDVWINILKVAVGLGMVIFVHELGHFAVAKMFGVKCEKFYLGFDIAGWKFCKFTWGETEYGIGILPLGGYVKMLGQTDNPARLKEEIELAKQQADTGRAESSDDAPPTPSKECEIDLAAAEAALYDPRSYLAQSVPKRMAIISAGVIMNLLFAVLMAAIAYKIGVKQIPCAVGQLIPGGAAWRVDLQVGDRITEIAGREMHRFRDLQAAISLGDDIDQGIPILVRRDGVEEPLKFTVTPDSSGLLPMIGIVSPRTTTLLSEEMAVHPASAAAAGSAPFRLRDKIIEIDGTPIENYAQLHGYLAQHPERQLQVTVERAAGSDAADRASTEDTSQTTIDVPPNSMQRLGLVMAMGEIVAVQADSPAATAGVRVGDRIVKIAGQSAGDPMTLPDRLRRRAGETVTLGIERENAKKPIIDIALTLRRPDWYEEPMAEGNPMTAPALGIAYDVLNRVDSVIPGSPAAAAGLRPGDRIVQAVVLPPERSTLPADVPMKQRKLKIDFDGEDHNWPLFLYALQHSLPGTQVELAWMRDDKRQITRLTPVADEDWFNADRGFLFEPVYFLQKAENWRQALRRGTGETIDSTLMVYRFLQKLGSQVSFKALGGPVMIFTADKRAADEGTAKLLIFLTVLSANLAVLNFLPIPVLDGGHMLFLGWEGIRGKPADERIQVALTYVGLIFLLALMLWVTGLDIIRLIAGF